MGWVTTVTVGRVTQGSGVRAQGLRAVAYDPFFSGFCGEMDL